MWRANSPTSLGRFCRTDVWAPHNLKEYVSISAPFALGRSNGTTNNQNVMILTQGYTNCCWRLSYLDKSVSRRKPHESLPIINNAFPKVPSILSMIFSARSTKKGQQTLIKKLGGLTRKDSFESEASRFDPRYENSLLIMETNALLRSATAKQRYMRSRLRV